MIFIFMFSVFSRTTLFLSYCCWHIRSDFSYVQIFQWFVDCGIKAYNQIEEPGPYWGLSPIRVATFVELGCRVKVDCLHEESERTRRKLYVRIFLKDPSPYFGKFRRKPCKIPNG